MTEPESEPCSLLCIYAADPYQMEPGTSGHTHHSSPLKGNVIFTNFMDEKFSSPVHIMEGNLHSFRFLKSMTLSVHVG